MNNFENPADGIEFKDEVNARRDAARSNLGVKFSDAGAPAGTIGTAAPFTFRVADFAQPRQEEGGIEFVDFPKTLAGGAIKGAGSAVRGAGKVAEGLGRVGVTALNQAFDAGLDLPSNPLEGAADATQDLGERVLASRTPEAKRREADSQPGGDIDKPETWTLGRDPSVSGLALQGLNALGSSVLPVAASAAAGPFGVGARMAAGAGAGGVQGGGNAIEQARETIDQLDDQQLAAASSAYREFIAQGVAPSEARARVRADAENAAFVHTLPVSAVGGAATGRILSPAGRVLGDRGVLAQTAGRAALAGTEEAVQEVGEGAATQTGINAGAGMALDPLEGSFGNAALGFAAGMGPGAVHGAADGARGRSMPTAPSLEAGDVMHASGKPFVTASAARQRAAELGGDTQVMRHENGFIVRPGRESEAAAQTEGASEQTQASPTYEQGDWVVWASANRNQPVRFLQMEPEARADGRRYAKVEVGGEVSYVPADSLARPGDVTSYAPGEHLLRQDPDFDDDPVRVMFLGMEPDVGADGQQYARVVRTLSGEPDGEPYVVAVDELVKPPQPSQQAAGSDSGQVEAKDLFTRGQQVYLRQNGRELPVEFLGVERNAATARPGGEPLARIRTTDGRGRFVRLSELAADPLPGNALSDAANGPAALEGPEAYPVLDGPARRDALPAPEGYAAGDGFTTSESWRMPANAPRGIRNNNPGNIQKGVGFDGEIAGNDPRFATFRKPEDGIRGLAVNLLTYQRQHGLDTVEGIINRWAPPSENDTGAYVQQVARAVGVEPNQQLDLSNPDTLTKLTAAIIQHENGMQPYSAGQMDEGITAALAGAPARAALPAPVYAVDGAGVAATAGQRDVELARQAALGMTPDVVAAGERHPGAATDAAAHEAATSPSNDLPEPTDAQKEAGNYKVGRTRVAGLDISIENPEGSERRGTSPDGTAWANRMAGHYGYIRRTEGADGDQVDVFVRPGTAADFGGPVFIIDQVDPARGGFDESKVMLGYDTREEAERAYRDSYTPDWRGMGKITQMDVPTFKRWIGQGDTTRPAADSGLGTLVSEPDITAKGGRPFLTRGAAQRAATAHGNAEPVQVDGGFVARPRTGQPAAAAPAAAEFGRAARRDFLQMVRQAGGIRPALAADIYGDRAHLANRRAPGLFRNGGMDADMLVEAMQQSGYLPMDGDTVDLAGTAMDRVREALEGEAVYTLEQMDEAARRAYAEREAERFSNAKDKNKLAEDLFGVIDAMPADMTMQELAAQFDAAAYLADQGITDVSTQEAIIERASIQADGDPDTFRQAVQSHAKALGRRDNGNPGRAAQESGERGDGAGAGSDPAGGPQALALENPTADGLRDQAASRARRDASQAQAAKDAETRARVDAEAGDFVLTGSDRDADRAAARGQRTLLSDGGPLERRTTEEPRPSAGVSVSEAKALAADFMGKLPGAAGLRVSVVARVDQIPEGAKPSTLAEGAYYPAGDGGRIYLVAENLPTAERLQQVLAHEVVGHFGVEALLGERFRDVLADVRRLARAPDGAHIPRNAGPEHPHYATFEAVTMRYPDYSAENRAREVLARMAEQGRRTIFLERLYGKIRAALRRLGLNLKLTNADIRQMVIDAGRFLQRAPAARVRAGMQEAAASMAASRGQGEGGAGVTVLTGQELGAPELGAKELRDAARAWATENLKGKGFVNRATGWRVQVSQRGIKESLSRSARISKIQSMAALPGLIEQAVLGHSEANRNKQRDPFTSQVHTLYAPVEIAGQDYLARLVVKESANGHLFYDHDLSDVVEAKRPDNSSAVSTPASKAGADRTPSGRRLTVEEIAAIVNSEGRAGWIFDPGAMESRKPRKEAPPAAGLRTSGPMESRAATATAGAPPADPGTPREPKRGSRIERPGESLSDFERRQRNKFLGKIGAWAEQEPIKARMAKVSDRWQAKLVQGIFDQFAPLKGISATAYMQARLSKGADGAAEYLVRHGAVKLEDGALDTAGGKGLAEILAGLNGEHDHFMAWIAANRAERLAAEWQVRYDNGVTERFANEAAARAEAEKWPGSKAEPAGRERLFTPEDIAAGKRLASGKMADGRDRASVYREALGQFNELQRSVLDVAQEAGLVDPSTRGLWESEFYVPFYRVMEDDATGTMGPGQIGGLVGQQAYKRLKGGTDKLGDLVANTVSNWSHLLSASMKNLAAQGALKEAAKLGIATRVRQAERGSVRAMVGGHEQHYMVSDPLVMNALTALHYVGSNDPFTKAARKFKHALTVGVTISPTFRVRNLLRDTIQAMAIDSNLSTNPLRNMVEGWKATGAESDTWRRLMAGGGAVRFGSFNDGNARNVKRLVDELGAHPDDVITSPAGMGRALRKAFDWYQETGDRSETINRAAIYQQARKAGRSHLEASYAARDLMDFTAGGTFSAIRMLSQVVPFFNARLQGMYKLGRGAAADPARFAVVSGAVAMASALLYLGMKDDDDYKQLPDWARNSFWITKLPGTNQFVYIPKPFEIGALGSVVERVTELAFGGDDFRLGDFGRSVGAILSDQLSMNPVPQLVKPAMEAAFNYDSFRERDIDSVGQQRLPAGDRFTASTSAGAVALGRTLGVSPQRVEHLVRGYFGWLGTQALNVSDYLARPLSGLPENPRRDLGRVDNWFVVGDFVKDADPRSSKYIQRFYDEQRDVNQVYSAYSQARELGDLERARALAGDDQLRLRTLFKAADSQLRAVNTKIKALERSTLSPEEKRAQLELLYRARNRLAMLADQNARAARP
ncbi:MAG: LPD38 domain-containing protein [Achromobacter sp.]|uniref:LPD38 domain-containing protein n=1 Tax=Achromobacter sp. TaxID=134375 RepID=UPI003D02C95C